MKLQNQYANAPIIVIIIKPITMKFSVTYDISPSTVKGIHIIFPNKIRNSKKQVFVNGQEVQGLLCL
jgi:hypothetical protein